MSGRRVRFCQKVKESFVANVRSCAPNFTRRWFTRLRQPKHTHTGPTLPARRGTFHQTWQHKCERLPPFHCKANTFQRKRLIKSRSVFAVCHTALRSQVAYLSISAPVTRCHLLFRCVLGSKQTGYEFTSPDFCDALKGLGRGVNEAEAEWSLQQSGSDGPLAQQHQSGSALCGRWRHSFAVFVQHEDRLCVRRWITPGKTNSCSCVPMWLIT